MSDFIGVDVRGIETLAKLLRDLPQEAKDAVVDEVSTYLLNVLRQNASYRYVSRRQAYGSPFVSDKQRKFVMAAIREGRINIPYRRTQGLRDGWQKAGEGEQSFLYNERPGAQYVIGDGTQSRHEAMVGWKQVSQTIKERDAQITRRGEAAAEKAIKKLGG